MVKAEAKDSSWQMKMPGGDGLPRPVCFVRKIRKVPKAESYGTKLSLGREVDLYFYGRFAGRGGKFPFMDGLFRGVR